MQLLEYYYEERFNLLNSISTIFRLSQPSVEGGEENRMYRDFIRKLIDKHLEDSIFKQFVALISNPPKFSVCHPIYTYKP